MEITAVVDRVGRIGAVRADDAAGRVECESALVELRGLRAWVDASEADLARRLAAMVSFPEQAIAETSKGSLGQASSVMERAATLGSTPAIAEALDRGAVTAGHVDAITRAGKTLDPAQREQIVAQERAIVDVVAQCLARVNPQRFNGVQRTPTTMALLSMLNFTFAWLKPDGPMSYEQYADLVAAIAAGPLRRRNSGTKASPVALKLFMSVTPRP